MRVRRDCLAEMAKPVAGDDDHPGEEARQPDVKASAPFHAIGPPWKNTIKPAGRYEMTFHRLK